MRIIDLCDLVSKEGNLDKVKDIGLCEMSLSVIMQIAIDGLPYKDYDSTRAVNKFLKQKQRWQETKIWEQHLTFI